MAIITSSHARPIAAVLAGQATLGERLVLPTAALVGIVLRVFYIFNHRADMDEPQHLHVVWSWVQGLVPYRDIFDNHGPLFHLAMAPFIGAFGEHAQIILFARWLMVPLVAMSLWATYRLGRELWSQWVGRWSAVLTGLVPSWLLATTEFRPDVLWMTGWLLSLVTLLCGRLTPRRAILAGMLLGVTLATSLKSILLILSLGLAGALTGVLFVQVLPESTHKRIVHLMRWMLAGTVIVPVMTLVVFWRLHALPTLLYCTITHNLVPGLGFWRTEPQRMLIFPIAVVILSVIAYRLVRPVRPGVGPRQVFVLLTTGFYVALLEAFWPLITKQDWLPVAPLMVTLVVAAIKWGIVRLGRLRPVVATGLVSTLLLATVAAVDVVSVNRTERAWRNANQQQDELLRQVVSITRPGELIMDLRGETVFRRRPYYYVIEDVYAARLENGLLADRVATDIVATHTHFAGGDNPLYPAAARRYLNEHFLSIGALRVLGAVLGGDPNGQGAERVFDVSYPERFALVADAAAAGGTLDGVRYEGARLLQRGLHRYRPKHGERHVAVLWEGAVERHLVPTAYPEEAR